MAISDEKLQVMKGLLARANTDVIGNCMFCEKPVVLTKEHIEKDIVDFGLVVQRLFFHIDNKHIQQDLQGFITCRECSLSPYKLKIAKQLSEVHVDLSKVNDTFAKALAKAAAKEQAEKALAEQLKSIETPIEEKTDEKVPLNA